jgi:nifR3 family TIM-barrel protein
MIDNKTSFQVGQLEISGDLILAPMDGYTSWPFRSICRELGSAISYTEFIKAEDVLERPHYIQDKIQFADAERPVFIQIYGHQPEVILEASLRLVEQKPDGIDINMGCPNRSIAGRGAGAGLMRTPLVAARIIKQLSAALDLPVTAKIRTGWQSCQNGELLAGIIERCGGDLVAVHARSKEMGHQGAPDLAALERICKQLEIPVIGNGGIKTVADIKQMKTASGCDAVMIGRAALENPWIFARRNREQVSPTEVQDLLLEHLDRSLSFHGPESGLVLLRKFAAAYLKPYNLEENTRKKLLTEINPQRFIQKIKVIFQELDV